MPVEYLDDEPQEQPERSIFTPQSPVATGLSEQFLDNILGLPNSLIRLDNRASNFMNEKLAGVLGQGPADFISPGGREVDEGTFNVPEGRQVMGGMDAALKMLTGDFDLAGNYQQGIDVRTQLEQENPGSFQFGNMVGDAATIFTGRAPFVRGAKAANVADKTGDILAPFYKKQLDKVFEPNMSGKISRVLGRTSEGAVEGSALAIMKDTDPMAAAGYAAGAQAASMAGLKFAEVTGVSDIARGHVVKGGGKLMGYALAIGGLLQFVDSGIPGDPSAWQQSVQAGFDKMVPMMIVGGVSALAGGGRASGSVPLLKGKLPDEITDALSALPRGVFQSGLVDMIKDRELQKTMERFVSDPGSFTDEEMEKIGKAFESGDLKSLSREVEIEYLD